MQYSSNSSRSVTASFSIPAKTLRQEGVNVTFYDRLLCLIRNYVETAVFTHLYKKKIHCFNH